MAKWMVSARKADFERIAAECGISPVLCRLIRNRGIMGAEETKRFLSCDASLMHDPFLLPDMDKAAAIVSGKIREGVKIRIIGDYDADGICASRILLLGLRTFGADADTVIPDRIRDGYGINERLVEEAHRDGVDTIITCDNGISAFSALEKAAAYGICVIVTDHHEVPFESVDANGLKEQRLVQATAVADPKRDALPGYPFREICGAVVAMKLMEALNSVEMAGGHPCIDRQVLDEMTALCAIATVCDVMPLMDENRYYVRRGLELLRELDNPGLKALMEVTGLSDRKITAYHAGFVLGPCLNASGRMDSAGRALELFDEKGREQALAAAGELRDLNESRKALTVQGVEKARVIAEEKLAAGQKILVIYLGDCHESLAGIVAGRIREEFERPVFVLTDSVDEGILKGSGRSVEAYDMFGGLTGTEDILIKYGGHKMAAGLTISAKMLDVFEERINSSCTLGIQDMEDVIHIDMELPPHLFTMEMVREFDLLEPYGTANPRPLFVTRDLLIKGIRIMGKTDNVCAVSTADAQGRSTEFVWFCDAVKASGIVNRQFGEGTFESLTGNRTGSIRSNTVIHAVYYPQVNSFRETERLQYVLCDLKKA